MMAPARAAPDAPKPLSVAELNKLGRRILEGEAPNLWVEGEVTEVARPGSGHVYFTLVDPKGGSSVRVVMFRQYATNALRARLDVGEKVHVRGGLTLYEPRGAFQLNAKLVLPAGAGDRAADVELVRRALAAEGLFDPQRKRALPPVPRVIGVVTSLKGAAVHDIVHVASERMGVRLVVAACFVQGPEAAGSIVRALTAIQRLPELEVVILARGGGASEDLSAFDDEQVARAVAACRVPVVTGVGHEVDVTLADLAADVRAATPSNAAEVVVPQRQALRDQLDVKVRSLARAVDRIHSARAAKLTALTRRIGDPRTRLAKPRRGLSEVDATLERHARRLLSEQRALLQGLARRLAKHEPRARLERDAAELRSLHIALAPALRRRLAALRQQIARDERALDTEIEARRQEARATLAALVGRLDALSPLGVLSRGYAIALHEPSGRALTRAADASVGDALTVVLEQGRLRARVEGHEP